MVYPILALPDGRIIDGHDRWTRMSTTKPRPVRVVSNLSDADALLMGQAINFGRARRTDAILKRIAETREPKYTPLFVRIITEMNVQGWSQRDIANLLGISHSQSNRLFVGCLAADAYPAETLTPNGAKRTIVKRSRRMKEWLAPTNTINEMTKQANAIGARQLAAGWTPEEVKRITTAYYQAADRLRKLAGAINEAQIDADLDSWMPAPAIARTGE